MSRRPNLIKAIQDSEGTVKEDGSHKPYDDSDDDLNDVIGKEGDLKGHCTIGYGRNLTVTGLSDQEATMLLKHDLERLEKTLRQEFVFWPKLERPRQNVLLEMAFHMGYGDLMAFEDMIRALQEGHYGKASSEIIDSQYGSEFPQRAGDLARRMREGVPYGASHVEG